MTMLALEDRIAELLIAIAAAVVGWFSKHFVDKRKR